MTVSLWRDLLLFWVQSQSQPKSTSTKQSKRNDIQCLRALAVIAVVAFHLLPETVPQGFLGVDVFFVISGYLMTSILNFGPSRSLTIGVLKHFYTRRFKRILPTYLLVILATLLAGTYFLLPFDFDEMLDQVWWALAFISNWHPIHENEGYFMQLGRFNLFLHTWSLGVEMQFYLVAPFLLFAFARVPTRMRFPLVYVLAGTSWIYQVFVLDPNTAFNSPFARLWQFLLGTLIFHCNLDATRICLNKEKILYVASSVTLLLTLLGPKQTEHWMYDVFVRSAATVLSCFVLHLGAQNFPQRQNLALTAASTVGDASYAIYLVHWPIIVLARYLLVFSNFSVLFWCFVIAFTSFAVFCLFERVLRRQSTARVFLVCTVLYLLCVAFFHLSPQALSRIFTTHFFPNSTISQPQNFTVHNNNETRTNSTSRIPLTLRSNMKIEMECRRTEKLLETCNATTSVPNFVSPKAFHAGSCYYKGLGKNRTLLIVGNSHAIHDFPVLFETLQGRFSDIYLLAQHSCMIFARFNRYWNCDLAANHLFDFLKALRPEVVLVIERLSEVRLSPATSIEQIRNDKNTLTMAAVLQKMSVFTDKIVHLEPNPTNSDKEGLHALLMGKDVNETYRRSINAVAEEVDPGWLRVQAAMQSCPKCVGVPTRHYFRNGNGNYDLYDPDTMATYFCDPTHFSRPAVLKFAKDVAEAVD